MIRRDAGLGRPRARHHACPVAATRAAAGHAGEPAASRHPAGSASFAQWCTGAQKGRTLVVCLDAHRVSASGGHGRAQRPAASHSRRRSSCHPIGDVTAILMFHSHCVLERHRPPRPPVTVYISARSRTGCQPRHRVPHTPTASATKREHAFCTMHGLQRAYALVWLKHCCDLPSDSMLRE